MFKFKINNVPFGYNFADANCMKVYEDAMTKCAEAQLNPPEDQPASAQIRYVCGVISETFDTILGEGSTEKIFGDSCDMIKYVDALGQMMTAAKLGVEDAARQATAISAKYIPNEGKKV